MRLIDADAHREKVMQKYDYVEEYIEDIDSQPTAYDVDKVVEGFQKESYLLVDECYKDGGVQVLLVEDAINIVKKGGVE